MSDLHICISEDCLAYSLKQSKTNQTGNPISILYFKVVSHLSP